MSGGLSILQVEQRIKRDYRGCHLLLPDRPGLSHGLESVCYWRKPRRSFPHSSINSACILAWAIARRAASVCRYNQPFIAVRNIRCGGEVRVKALECKKLPCLPVDRFQFLRAHPRMSGCRVLCIKPICVRVHPNPPQHRRDCNAAPHKDTSTRAVRLHFRYRRTRSDGFGHSLAIASA